MTWDYLATAHGLARYFEGQTTALGDIWDLGKRAARTWETVLVSSSVSTDGLRHLDELMLEGRGDPGSGWEELLLAYDSWREAH